MKKFAAIITTRLFTGFMLLFFTFLMTGGAVKADNSPNINYIDASGNIVSRPAASTTPVSANTSNWSASTTEGWYVVDKDAEFSDRIEVTGDVHLILKDNTHLSASHGIWVGEGNSLTIYAQSSSETVGSLTATGPDDMAGIGGNRSENAGTITINGGTINAKGGEYSAGIGGGEQNDLYQPTDASIVINGGTVNATGGWNGAGIGGGYQKKYIYHPNNASIIINGGTVKATGGNAGAGIGGGSMNNGGSITITGGTVSAEGGEDGAGIGGGYYGYGGITTITGGSVTAIGSKYNAGIGGSRANKDTRCTITGGTVTAIGGQSKGAGIGAAFEQDGGIFSTSQDTIIGNAVIFAVGGSGVSAIVDQSSSSSWSGVIFQGADGYVYGSPTPTEDFTIPSGKSLIIDTEHGSSSNRGTLSILNGRKMTVSSGANFGTANDGAGHLGKLVNNGTINNSGTFVNFGAFSGSSVNGTNITIETQPDNQTVFEGNSASFSTSLHSAPTFDISYQWQLSSSSIGGWSSSGITNGQTSSYTISATDTSMNGNQYRCGINVAGVQGYTNAAMLTVNEKTYGITLNPSSSYAFPAAIIGYTQPAAQTVTVNNTGNQPTGDLSVALSGANSSSFQLASSSITSISAGSSASFTVQPLTGLVPREYNATVTVSGGSGIVNQKLPVSFTVNKKTYGIALNPSSSMTFDPVFEGYLSAPAAQTVTVSNTGNQATGELSVALSGANSSSFQLASSSITSISAGSSASFTVQPVTGLAPGEHSATVTVSGGSGSSSVNQTLPVSFTVNKKTYGITLNPSSSMTFDPVIEGYTQPVAQTVTVSNTGNQPTGDLSVALSGANSSSFQLTSSSILSISAGSSASFTVQPKIGLPLGNYNAEIEISGENNISAKLPVSFTVQNIPPTPITTYSITTQAASASTGTVTANPTTVVAGGSTVITAAPAEGFVLEYWEVNGTVLDSKDNPLTISNIQQNTTVKAYFKRAQTITFDSMDGNSENKQDIGTGDTLSRPKDPTRDGYTFEGWYTDKEYTAPYDFSTPVNSNITLYAKWIINKPSASPVITYNTYVENLEWTGDKTDGDISGTSGQALRMEEVKATVSGVEGLGVSYSVHVQNKGWLDAVADGEAAGTEHQGLRLEAINMELTGEQAANYDIYYRVHAQNIGWMSWAKNGENAGTQGLAMRLEAVQMMIVEKGADAPEQNPKADITKAFIEGYNLYAKAHGRNYGWSQVQKANQIYPTMTVGTTGQGLRMEAIQLSDDSADTQLTCKVHVQNKGWLDAVAEGQTAGTTGQALRVEAIEIDGSTPDGVSVQYRAHIAGIGWQDWKNLGEVAGTTGQARAIEAIEFRVVAE